MRRCRSTARAGCPKLALLAAVGIREEHERHVLGRQAAVLRDVTVDLNPAAVPIHVAGGGAVRFLEALIARVRGLWPFVVVAGRDVDVGHAAAALDRFDHVGLHEQQIVVLMRDQHEIAARRERQAGAEIVVAARRDGDAPERHDDGSCAQRLIC